MKNKNRNSEVVYFHFPAGLQQASLLAFLILFASVISVRGNTLNVPGDHATIQAAVTAAASGDTIDVGPGSYPESVTINKPLTLRGPNYGNSPNSGSRSAEATITGVVSISSALPGEFVIEGFRFEGATPLLTNGVPAPVHHDIVFRKNLVEGGSNQIAVFTADPANTTNVTIDDNRFLGMVGNAMQLAANGAIEASITNNVIDGTGNAGINADALTNSNISGNIISNTAQQGIQIAGVSSNVAVLGNTFTNTNTSDGADRGAIRIYGSSFTGPVSFTGNVINGGNTAFAVRNGEDISGKDIQFTGNTMTGVNVPFVYHGGTGTLDATANFWGSAAGPVGLVTGDVNAANFFSDQNLSGVFSRPDVGIGSNATNLRSVGQVSAPGAEIPLTSRAARPVKGLATVSNLGGLTEAIAVRATKGNRLIRVKYLTNAGNITGSMAAGPYRTPLLDASSSAVVIRAAFTLKRSKRATKNSNTGVLFSSLLLANSTSDASLSDGGWWRVRVR